MFPDKVLTADHVCIPNERVDSIIKTRQNNVCYTWRLKIDDNHNLVNHGGKLRIIIIRCMLGESLNLL